MKTNLGDTRRKDKLEGDTRHTFQKWTTRRDSKARKTSLPLQREQPGYRRQQELRLRPAASAAGRAATKTSGGIGTGTSAIRKGSATETWKRRQKRGLRIDLSGHERITG